MKPFTALLGLSVALNVGLVSAFILRPTLAPPAVRSVFQRASSAPEKDAAARTRESTAAKSKGRGDSAAQNQLWAALDSDDLPTLVKRLRAAGFSRAAIIGVLNARLDARFADRSKALLGDMESTPFWKQDPMNSPNSRYWEEYSQIYRDRSRLMRELLGDELLGWGVTDPATAQRRQFGSIPKEKIDLVQRINDDYADMTSQVRAAMQGITLPEDREKIALLEREKRADLAAILTPAELEEYEMRSSSLMYRLRPALSIMDASEDEFRSIFKVQQAFNERVNPTMSGIVSAQMMEDRREAQKQMNEQMKAALSPERYNDYLRSTNSEYQALYRIGQKDNVPAATVTQAFSIRDAISAESVRIAENTALSADQKREALTALAQKGKTQILSTLGPGPGEAYAQTATRWLSNLERGYSFTFGPDGNPISRPVAPTPRPTPPSP